MSVFICPVCGGKLEKDGKVMKCAASHCYDISKKGYINLLMSQKMHNHGDDRLMVNARRDFLDKGYYEPLRELICNLTEKYTRNGDIVYDSGCGEGWYTAAVSGKTEQKNVRICGVDISKFALNVAAQRCPNGEFAVASVFAAPFADRSIDVVMSFFAPFAREEYLRILKKGGIFITAFPLENHLFELKSAVYDKPYKNEVSDMKIDGFICEEHSELRYSAHLSVCEDIKNLFMMTPYYYKTSEHDQKKLDKLNELDTRIEFCVAVYRKI